MGFDPTLARAVPHHAMRFLGHEEHVHDVPHLVHIVMGHGVLTAPGHRLTLEPRSSVWLQAGVPHALALADHSIALGPVMRPGVAPDRPLAVLGVVPAITDLMLARLAAGPSTPEQCDLFTSALEAILLGIARVDFPAPLPTHAAARRIGLDACAVPDLTLAALCARHGISSRHVQRIFRQETGMTFRRWRRRRLLGRAVQSLRGGSSPAAAAHATGFGSRANLLRALAQESGEVAPEHAGGSGEHGTGVPA
ncbi:helix-turn-helix domain-containing protein [Brachybacterium hainanense]|uniref:Helix-turn-helix domain-containing protein n=1 Tax=Brachybacterium hainanense TaxID=1541174 RepID=A0ABV6R6H5_9MICO